MSRTYRLVRPNKGHVDFASYQQMLASLHQYRDALDHIFIEERDKMGNVHSTLNNDEVRQIVAELDGIVLPTFQSNEAKDT